MDTTNDEISFKFNAISKIMEQYMHFFYTKHKAEDSNNLLKFHNYKIQIFHNNVNEQAKKISRKMKKGCYPDRHKIIAACLKSFVVSGIFSFDMDEYNELIKSAKHNDDSLTLYILYPNEMFCLEIIKIILNQYATFKNIDNYDLKYADNIVGLEGTPPHNYIIDLFKLILGYNKKSLDFVVQELAHIIFFIEMGYEISIKDLKQNYYNFENANV